MAEKEYRELKCGHCANYASMEVVRKYYIELGSDDFPEGDVYQLLICPACNNISLISFHLSGMGFDVPPVESEDTLLYPVGAKMPEGLPPEIQKNFESASKVKNIDANAYGVLIRRTIDLVCIDRKAEGRDLYEKLTYLSKNNEFPGTLADIATHLRVFGNIGAHPDLGELTKEEVPLLEDLCLAILEYIYRAPHLVQKAQKAMDKIKKQ